MSGSPVLLGDRYEVGEPLGRGGMATVHLALDRRLERVVAVKQLSPHLAADATAQARFRREAQASASLNHPAIASVFDTGESNDPATGVSLPYIVMELVEGSTLRTLLESGPLPPERALRVAHSVLDALEHSHAMGLVHRDIKPANVMITHDGTVKVMDFGIARAIDESATSLTKATSVIGTAHYLSPEQALGEKVDLRSDLYSVGCLLFELVTGRPPFVGDTSLAIVYQHVRENPVPPSQLEPSLDPSFDAVVLRALAKSPDDRYQDAAAMRDDVDRVLAGEPVAPPPPPSDPPTSETALLPGRLLAAPAAVAVVGGASGASAAAATTPADPVTEPALVPAGTEPPQRRRPAAALIALAAFLVLGLVAFAVFRLSEPPAAASHVVAVPDVVGQPQAKAELALFAVGLLPRVTQGAGKDGEPLGAVIDQDPGVAAEVMPGATVTLTVNVGSATAKLPDDLVGRPVQDVERRLAALGFTDVSTEAVTGEGDAEPGDVVSVKPAEGEQVPLAATVVVRFARGGATTTSGGDDSTPPAPAPGTTESGSSSAPTTSADPADEREGGTSQDDDEPPAGAPATRGPTSGVPATRAPTAGNPATRAPATRAPTAGAPTTRAPTRLPLPTATVAVPPAQDPTTVPQPQPTTTEVAEDPDDDDDDDKKGKGKGKGRGRGKDDDGD